MLENSLVLALDIGTSSARAIAYDSTATPISRAQRTYALITDPPGAAVLDADNLVDFVSECIDFVLDQLGDSAKELKAVGCCAFWHSMVGIDTGGKAITPLYTWADNRSAESAVRIRTEVDSVEIHQRTGCTIHESYFPTRLRWLAEFDPVLFRRVHRWVSPGEYIYMCFFGRASCSISMASATGLFDQNACHWDSEMLSVSGIAETKLSPLTDTDRPDSGLLPKWADRWPALARIPWVPAIGDGASGNLGSACLTTDSAAINLGTSGAIRLVWESTSIEAPPELWCYRLDRRRFVVGAAFSDGGEVYSWMRRTLHIPGSDKDIDRALMTRVPDSHGLTFLPFLAGERSIGWRTAAKATIHGISLSTTSLDILQAAMEGVALRFHLIWQIMTRYFPQLAQVIVSGGAIRESRSWQQMLANALGNDIVVSADSEASSRGAAILALLSAGIIENESDIPMAGGQRVEFNPEAHELMRNASQRQQNLYYRLDCVSPETTLKIRK